MFKLRKPQLSGSIHSGHFMVSRLDDDEDDENNDPADDSSESERDNADSVEIDANNPESVVEATNNLEINYSVESTSAKNEQLTSWNDLDRPAKQVQKQYLTYYSNGYTEESISNGATSSDGATNHLHSTSQLLHQHPHSHHHHQLHQHHHSQLADAATTLTSLSHHTGVTDRLGSTCFHDQASKESFANKSGINSHLNHLHQHHHIQDNHQLANIEEHQDNDKLSHGEHQHAVTIDTSLKKLLDCMSLYYCSKLTSPKWKSFKGLKLRLKYKIRLNNLIWRAWFLQCIRGRRPPGCQFTAPVETDVHKKCETTILEGKYWKRKEKAIVDEYKKWRIFHKQKSQMNCFRPSSFDWDTRASNLYSMCGPEHHFCPDYDMNMGYNLEDLPMQALEDLETCEADNFYQPPQAPIRMIESQPLPQQPPQQPEQHLQIHHHQHHQHYQQMQHQHPHHHQQQQQLAQMQFISEQHQHALSLKRLPPHQVSPSNQRQHHQFNQNFSQQQQQQPVALASQPLPHHQPQPQHLLTTQAITTTASVTPSSNNNLHQATCQNPPPSSTATAAATRVAVQSSTANDGGITNNALPPFSFDQQSHRPMAMYQQQQQQLAEVGQPQISISPSTSIAMSQQASGLPASMSLAHELYQINGPMAGGRSSIGAGSNSSSASNASGGGRSEQRRVCHINAEQKRRCNIKNGFDTLKSILPSINQNVNVKISKASMLQKAAQYISTLSAEQSQQMEEKALLKQQIEGLKQNIAAYQCQLPASGGPVGCPGSSQAREMLQEYVKTRTLGNWKFWIFSLLIEPLFETYYSSVSANNLEDSCKTILTWLDRSCGLVSLRKDVLESLTFLSTSTNILNTPQTLPSEAVQAVRYHHHHQQQSSQASNSNNQVTSMFAQ